MMLRLRAPSYPSLVRKVDELQAQVDLLAYEREVAQQARDIAEEERAAAISNWNKRVVRFGRWKRDAQSYALANRLADVLEATLYPASGDASRPVYDAGRELRDARAQLESATPESVEQ